MDRWMDDLKTVNLALTFTVSKTLRCIIKSADSVIDEVEINYLYDSSEPS